MPKQPRPRIHKGNGQWCANVGEWVVDRSGRGRRRTVYFPEVPPQERYRP
jgi:hypothetical protein